MADDFIVPEFLVVRESVLARMNSMTMAVDGDVEGHPFYGNQHIGGMSYSRMNPEQKVKALLKAKKMLQPANKKNFTEAQLKSAEGLIKHANAWKGKAVEKVVGVAKKSTENKQAKVSAPMAAAIAAAGSGLSPLAAYAQAGKAHQYTSSGLHHADEFKWTQKIKANSDAIKAGKSLPNPMTAKHINWVAEQKGDPKPYPNLESKAAPEYHKFTDTTHTGIGGSKMATGTPYPNSSPNAPASVAPPPPKAPDTVHTVESQMKHTTRDAPLSTPQYNAIKSYTGTGYHAMNNHLRLGQSASTEVKEHIKHMDDAFKGAALKEPMIVYRGVSREIAQKLFGDELHTGMVVMDKGFVSTSTSKSFAENWKGAQGILLEIHAPKGAPALDVHKLSSSGKHEEEILLPRDIKFKVEAVSLPPMYGDKPIKVRVTYEAA